MALFKKTTKKETPKVETKSTAVKNASAKGAALLTSHILISPRVTEKAAIGSEVGVYVFNVTKSATKPMVSAAIVDLFKVTPRKVRIVNIKPTTTMTRTTGRKGRTNGGKKAYVYLKKGEKIELA